MGIERLITLGRELRLTGAELWEWVESKSQQKKEEREHDCKERLKDIEDRARKSENARALAELKNRQLGLAL